MSKRKIFGEIPQEVSENIKAPETAPSDKRFTGRTKQLNFKVREEFYWQLKNRAVEEKCMMVEVLERAFVEYEREKRVEADKELERYVKVIETKPKKPKSQKKLNLYFNQNFTCDNCYNEFHSGVAYSTAPNLDQAEGYYTYCSNCVG